MRPALAWVMIAAAAGVAAADEPAVDVEALVAQLSDDDPDLRLAARDGLRDAGDAAVPALRKISPGEKPLARQAQMVLREIAFDDAVKAALAGGDSWLRWDRGGSVKAWIRLSAAKREGKEKGYTLTETLFLGDSVLTQTATTDRDLILASISATLTDGKEKKEIRASFDGTSCAFESEGQRHDMPYVGTPFTDFTFIRFANAFIENPTTPDIVIWDTTDSEPATSQFHVNAANFVNGPTGASMRATPVEVEGLVTAFVAEDHKTAFATHGRDSLIVPVEEKDVPEKIRKK